MKVIVQFEDNDNIYEIPLSKILPFLKIKQQVIESAIKQAIRRI